MNHLCLLFQLRYRSFHRDKQQHRYTLNHSQCLAITLMRKKKLIMRNLRMYFWRSCKNKRQLSQCRRKIKLYLRLIIWPKNNNYKTLKKMKRRRKKKRNKKINLKGDIMGIIIKKDINSEINMPMTVMKMIVPMIQMKILLLKNECKQEGLWEIKYFDNLLSKSMLMKMVRCKILQRKRHFLVQ